MIGSQNVKLIGLLKLLGIAIGGAQQQLYEISLADPLTCPLDVFRSDAVRSLRRGVVAEHFLDGNMLSTSSGLSHFYPVLPVPTSSFAFVFFG